MVEVTQAYNFKQKAEASDNALRQYLTLGKVIGDSNSTQSGN